MEKQVVILYALVNGYLAKIENKDVARFNNELINQMEVKNPEILKEIKKKKVLDNDIEEKLKSFLDNFVELFEI